MNIPRREQNTLCWTLNVDYTFSIEDRVVHLLSVRSGAEYPDYYPFRKAIGARVFSVFVCLIFCTLDRKEHTCCPRSLGACYISQEYSWDPFFGSVFYMTWHVGYVRRVWNILLSVFIFCPWRQPFFCWPTEPFALKVTRMNCFVRGSWKILLPGLWGFGRDLGLSS